MHVSAHNISILIRELIIKCKNIIYYIGILETL